MSAVTLMSRPTTGGTLLKPSNLTHTQTFRKRKGQERESISKSKGYSCSIFLFNLHFTWIHDTSCTAASWMSNSNVGPAGCTDHQATHCLLTQCDSLCTCPGERQRSLRCAFQSRRSRRGLRPSLHLWIVCATRNRLEHEHTRLYANVLGKKKEKWPLVVI